VKKKKEEKERQFLLARIPPNWGEVVDQLSHGGGGLKGE